jgi:Flp pilus assembly protein TadD
LAHQLLIKPRFGPRSRALVIDGHVTARSILVSHLRSLGIQQVQQCGRAHAARQRMEARGFDVVLCEQQLEGGSQGSELIDDLRRLKLLSLGTVVIMLSSVSSREVVSHVAESALDGFLIKPYSTRALEERLMKAFVRKESLREILDAVEAERYVDGLAMCEARFDARGPYWTHAARIGAELALRLDNLPLASVMYDAVWADKAVPWAKLGLARVLEASGQAGAAVSTIENLLAAEPAYADAYDVMGKIHVAEGDFEKAMNAYRRAVEITPTSVLRLQKFGMLAYYAGDQDTALEALQQAAVLGAGSPKFDQQSLLLLAFAKQRQGTPEALSSCRAMLDAVVVQTAEKSRPNPAGAATSASPSAAGAAGTAQSPRMQRLADAARAFLAILDNDMATARAMLDSLAAARQSPAFDAEAATNLLSLLAVMNRAELTIAAAPGWVRDAALRFCTSKQAIAMLVQACGAVDEHEAEVRKAAAELSEETREALSHSLAGEPRRAVEQLLDWGERTRNAKLLRDAAAIMARYRDRIDGVEALLERCKALQDESRVPVVLPPIVVA